MKIILKQIFFSLLFLFVFNVIFILKRQILPGNIIFYESNLLLMILILMVFLFFVYKKFETSYILPAYLSTLLFISLVPTIIDRSVSITVLGSIAKHNEGVNIDVIKSDFTKVYIVNNDAVSKRINEQLNSDNIKRLNNNYFLTEKGKFVVFSIKQFTSLYNIDTSYIQQ